jgi:pimeloyl-ACP methyl ester carboxylesterase
VDDAVVEFQPEIFQSVWSEADKLRKNGDLIKFAGRISCPVVAIHGDYDPHPSEGIKEPLSRELSDFRFVLLPNCGHFPWKEKLARKDFFEILDEELS